MRHELRRRLYFTTEVGPYRVGKWYDNVPKGDFDLALANAWAKVVEEDLDCGCMLVEGRAIVVREMQHTAKLCEKHFHSALIKPTTSNPKKLTPLNLQAAAEAAGLLKRIT